MKTIAYSLVSTITQDLNNQKLAILDFAQKVGFKIDEFVEITISSRRAQQCDQLQDTITVLVNSM